MRAEGGLHLEFCPGGEWKEVAARAVWGDRTHAGHKGDAKCSGSTETRLQHPMVPFLNEKPDQSKLNTAMPVAPVVPAMCSALPTLCTAPPSPALLLDVLFPGPPRWPDTTLCVLLAAAVTDRGTLQLSP